MSSNNEALRALIKEVVSTTSTQVVEVLGTIVEAAVRGDKQAFRSLVSHLNSLQTAASLVERATVLLANSPLPSGEESRAPLEELATLEMNVRNALLELGGSEYFSPRRWYELCAALDSIGDTALALGSFLFDRPPTRHGSQYLRLFGMLACTTTQQDSIQYLEKEFTGTRTRWEGGAAKLRTLRNKVAIHPATNGGSVARQWIAEDTIPFLLWSDGEAKHEDVDVRQCLLEYLEVAGDRLSKVLDAVEDLDLLEAETVEHERPT